MARSKNAVYGQNGQKWPFVRKNSAVSDPVYGQMLKKPALSVNSHHNGQKFTDKSSEKAGLSVKMRFAYGQISKKRHFVRKFE